MAEREQSYKSHRRYYPWHHFIVQPILIVNMGVEIARTIDAPTGRQLWSVAVAAALAIFSFTSKRFPILRCAFDSLEVPSNCR